MEKTEEMVSIKRCGRASQGGDRFEQSCYWKCYQEPVETCKLWRLLINGVLQVNYFLNGGRMAMFNCGREGIITRSTNCCVATEGAVDWTTCQACTFSMS
ncbi:hypothetical protein SIL73_08185 [Acidithiobacillus thiooxidans]|uniref:hypothetical protein n=1 Tax=Acidithiobacillus thiooxidans TaxID=930 RepID=UPI0029C1B4D7|nr:hypothetical protein [Acidithiobacillus thiooxidans]MDX5934667.1 hypothetical protein [Acidithiobacillus thiooxidans]